MTRTKLVIDISQVDALSLREGHFRYALDLIQTLASREDGFRIVALGSRAEPAPPLGAILNDAPGQVEYLYITPSTGRGSFYVDNIRYGLWLRRNKIALYHQLHLHLPFLKPCPYVLTYYDARAHLFNDTGLLRSRPYRYFLWAVKNLVDQIICISDATADDCRERMRWPPQRIGVVNLGCSDKFLSFKAPPVLVDRSSTGKLVVLAPYNMDDNKNLPALLRAFQSVHEEFSQLELHLFGNSRLTPEKEARFEGLCRSLGIIRWVKRLGFVDDDQLMRLYNCADVFAFASTFEGFGLPLLEAMACGACCLARNAPPMSHIAGDAALLVETKDPVALSQGLIALLSSQNLRETLRRKAKQRAALFTTRKMVQETVKVYSRLLHMPDWI